MSVSVSVCVCVCVCVCGVRALALRQSKGTPIVSSYVIVSLTEFVGNCGDRVVTNIYFCAYKYCMILFSSTAVSYEGEKKARSQHSVCLLFCFVFLALQMHALPPG